MASPKKIGVHAPATLRMVDPRELTLNPENERDYVADSDINVSLRQSIKAEGIKTHLEIYEDGVVSDGNRRLFNIGLLLAEGHEIAAVPTIVVERPANTVEAVFHRLNKNEAAQFSALEQGRAFAKLRAEGVNNSQIAARSPFTPMHVGNMLTLIDASEAVHNLVSAGTVSATLAVTIIRQHGEPILLEAVEFATGQGSNRVTQRHVDAVLASKAPKPEPTQEAPTGAPAPDAPFDGGTPVTDAAAPPADAPATDATPQDTADLSDAQPPAPKVDSEAEVPTGPTGGAPPAADASAPPATGATAPTDGPTDTPTAPDSSNPGPTTPNAKLTPKTLVDLIAPVALALFEAMEGSNKDKLEALADNKDDLAAFVANCRKAGYYD